MLQPNTNPITVSNPLAINASGVSLPVTFSGGNITLTGTISNTTTPITLDVNNTTSLAGVIQASANGITMAGSGNLQITASSPTYTGAVVVNSGDLTLSGNGSIGSLSYTVNQGGTLTVDDTGTNLFDTGTAGVAGVLGRMANTAALALNGGTFSFLGSQTVASMESLGVLTLASGNSTISSTNGPAGSVLAFSSLVRAANTGTVNFVAPAGAAALGPMGLNQVIIGPTTGTIAGQDGVNPLGLNNILPFGTVTGPTGSYDFASNLGSGSVGAFTAYTVGLANATTGTEVVKLIASDPTTVTAQGKTIAALLVATTASTPLTLSLIGTLTITTGSVATTGTAPITITGGSLTPSSPTTATGELIALTNTGSSLTLNSPIDLTPGSTATAIATISSGAGTVSAITVNPGAGGFGYTSPPVVTLTGGGSTVPGALFVPATATAIVSGGVVTGFSITNPGMGYVTPPAVSVAAPTVQATGVGQFDPGTGEFTGITLTNGGAGYAFAPATSPSPAAAAARARRRSPP